MYIAYMDETGDDGFPERSSELFVLTSVYMHNQNWKDNFNKIYEFRKKLKADYGFPVKMEFHANAFLTDKNPYRPLKFTIANKKEILRLYFDLISLLEIRIINVVIVKPNITNENYDVLDKALTYNVQRIENDLRSKDPSIKFLIITDEGRIKKMVETTRKIQKINYIPSKYSGSSYRDEIQRLIEDPLPKKSGESYFIQIADMVSFIVYLYSVRKFISNSDWANRLKNTLTFGDEIKLLDIIKNVLNLKANQDNEYGIVHYPK